jgi:hypothetical protein
MVIEDHERELVGRVEEDRQKVIEGFASIGDAPAVHAVAGIEQDPDADRDAVARELGDRLRCAVLEHLETAREADPGPGAPRRR